MSRNTVKAQRLREIERKLGLRPYGTRELAAAFGVSARTIERDLQDLRDMGIAVEEHDHRYSLPSQPGALNDVEALAVHSAARLLQHTGIGERHYRQAMEKLAGQLPDPARRTLLRATEALPTQSQDRTLDLVAQAWFQSRVLRCTYHGARSGSERTLNLEVWFYELNPRNLDPYVIAYDRTHALELRVYKLARMTQVRLLPDRYVIPEAFDPLEHMSGAWGIVIGEPIEVDVAVSAEVAFWFTEPNSQAGRMEVLNRHDDGSLVVRLSAHTTKDGDIHELLSFLLGWGSRIKVLAPAAVQERVAEELKAAAQVYAS